MKCALVFCCKHTTINICLSILVGMPPMFYIGVIIPLVSFFEDKKESRNSSRESAACNPQEFPTNGCQAA